MDPWISLSESELKRYAFRFDSNVVRAMLPAGVIGAYLLLRRNAPVYIGRSDHCLRSRLANHPMLGRATHVAWEPCRGPFQAFCLEAFWYHRILTLDQHKNLVHPARPAHDERGCPFCSGSETVTSHGIASAIRPAVSATRQNAAAIPGAPSQGKRG